VSALSGKWGENGTKISIWAMKYYNIVVLL
jgi:hypothetical protein